MSQNLEVLKPEEQQLTTKAASFRERLEAMEVNTPDEYLKLMALRTECDEFISTVTAEKQPEIDRIASSLNFMKERLARWVDPVSLIIDKIKTKGADYNKRKRLEAEEATRKENEERQKKAEREAAERRRVAAEKAEADRLEAERKAEEKRQADAKQAEADKRKRQKEIDAAKKDGVVNEREAKRLADQAQKDADEKKRLAEEAAERVRQQAKEDEERHNRQAAEEAANLVANVPKVEVLPDRITTKGYRGGGTWKATEINTDKLLQAFLDAAPEERVRLKRYLCAHEKNIGYDVREIKNKAKAEAAIPGITVEFMDR
jgi:hypothetical protein